MELKLNIYNKKEVVKTYTAETYDLMFGTVEDFLNILNVDNLKTGSDAEITKLVLTALPKGMGSIKSLLKDVFVGLTDEEIKNTQVKEITSVLVDIVKTSIMEIGKGVDSKN